VKFKSEIINRRQETCSYYKSTFRSIKISYNGPLKTIVEAEPNTELEPTLNVIGNVSQSTSILMNGEDDSQSAIRQQAFLLEQRLTEDHPDHTLITSLTWDTYSVFVAVVFRIWTYRAICTTRFA
jgi:hypothetical protein